MKLQNDLDWIAGFYGIVESKNKFKEQILEWHKEKVKEMLDELEKKIIGRYCWEADCTLCHSRKTCSSRNIKQKISELREGK